MTFRANKTALAAAVAMTATVGLALPGSATPSHSHGMHAARHHAMIRNHAYRMGYRQGFRDGHYAMAGADVTTGRSAYVGPGPVAAANEGVFGNGGVLGLGILGGNGLLGTGVLNGQGALGLGVPGIGL